MATRGIGPGRRSSANRVALTTLSAGGFHGNRGAAAAVVVGKEEGRPWREVGVGRAAAEWRLRKVEDWTATCGQEEGTGDDGPWTWSSGGPWTLMVGSHAEEAASSGG